MLPADPGSAERFPFHEIRSVGAIRKPARIRTRKCGNPRDGACVGGTIGIIQARMGSERLPGKILAPLAGRPVLGLLLDRVRNARVDEWWLATSSDPADDVTEAWGFELGLRVFRGHPNDVLSRFVAVGEQTGVDWIIRATADNPFLDAAVVDHLVDARDQHEGAKRADAIRLEGGLPLLSIDSDPAAGRPPARSPGLPVGYGVELVRREALLRAEREIPAHQAHHRVHVTSWLYAHGQVASFPTPSEWPDRPGWRWTLDTVEDLAMARSAFRAFGSDAATIDYPAMVERLDAHPEIVAMNRHIEQKRLEEG